MKVDKIVRCTGTWEEINTLSHVIDKLGLEFYKHSTKDQTGTVWWVLEIRCKDLMVEW